jgi:hypothetical protein
MEGKFKAIGATTAVLTVSLKNFLRLIANRLVVFIMMIFMMIFFCLPASVFHGLACCVTHFIVRFATELDEVSTFVSRKERGEAKAQRFPLCVRCSFAGFA